MILMVKGAVPTIITRDGGMQLVTITFILTVSMVTVLLWELDGKMVNISTELPWQSESKTDIFHNTKNEHRH